MNQLLRPCINLAAMLALSGALSAAENEKEYLFTYLQTTGMRQLLQDEATGKAYIVEWTAGSEAESLKTFGDALSHYITGAEEEGQRVYVRGHLGTLKGRFDGQELYEFTMTGWFIVVPFPFNEVVGKEVIAGQTFDKHGRVVKRSLREIGLDTYQWKGETRSYARYERRATNAVASTLQPVVEIEEDIYTYEPANNGAGPMWCSGSTCLVRSGDDVFASGLETLKGARPLNNCRWMLFKRGRAGWEKVCVDDTGRTREPCPLAVLADGRLFLSANPTLARSSTEGGGPAEPEILRFSTKKPARPVEKLLPVWDGKPQFTEHSYRSFAADSANGELILFQNVDYTHAEWAFLGRDGSWSGQGRLKWPFGTNYDKPQPIRVCYPTVALKNRAVYFCGVSDIVEPYDKWREFKKQITGKDWDYDFRRLFFTWTPDITREAFRDWIEIASRDQTAGWVSPADLQVAPDGAVHLLWTDRAIDERLRGKFFPDAKQSYSLNYAIVRNGKVASRRTLVQGGGDSSEEIPAAARFQVTPEERLFVFYYVYGRGAAGKPVSENRLLEIRSDGTASESVTVPLKRPFTSFFTATPRAGSPSTRTLELLGQRAGLAQTMSYARIRLGR